MCSRWLLALLLIGLATTARADLPAGATLLDSDIVWDPTLTESVAVSPDGKQIAYVSRGALWLCDVLSGTPTKLAELPNTVTAFLSLPEYESERQQFAGFVPNPGLQPLRHMRFDLVGFFNLRWTASQEGVTYTLWHRLSNTSMHSSYRTMQVSTRGVVTQLADIVQDMVALPESRMSFHVTPDRQHVIMSNFGIPLIWDCKTNKPRVTPFDFLLPSKTSDRFLGVEIDTRQLVLVDKDFQVIKRFEVVLEQDRRCDLFWSPDERTAICRSFRSSMEQISNYCTFFCVDLSTGQRSESIKGNDADEFYFSGFGTETIRIGVTGAPPKGYGNGTHGSYLEILPDGNAAAREIVRFADPGPKILDWHRHSYPPVVVNQEGSLFCLALPRTEATPGFHYYLIDRKGQKWPFPPNDGDAHFYSPYLPLAFVDEGRTLIARNATQLFSVSVESIKANGSKTND